MATFLVWEDGELKQGKKVAAQGTEEALDKVASKVFGFADYSDMAQERGWGENEGLNIVDEDSLATAAYSEQHKGWTLEDVQDLFDELEEI